jgi:hypothetical protein
MRKLCAVFALSLLPLAAASLGAQDSGESLPKLISHADAVYPAIARTAHIMGDVVVRIKTDGQSVVEAVAESGPPLLRRSSEDNAKTWKFAPHTPSTFHVTFSYKISADDVAAATSFPYASGAPEVEVVTTQAPMIIDYAWVGLGRWRAELRSSHGRLSKEIEFSFSGPNDEWLDVNTPGSPDKESEEKDDDDEFGHKDSDVLTFSMRVAEPDGKRLQTYFVGKLSGDRIIGTFVDESGSRGTWSATRIPDRGSK